MAPSVYLERCEGYSAEKLALLIADLASMMALQQAVRGKTILLKPNLISARTPHVACTNPQFIASVGQWFLDHGGKVKVGDSPAFGSARAVLKSHNGLDLLDRLGIPVVEFSTPCRKMLPDGRKITLAAEALECDLLVNLPKVKAHNQMYTTLATKNLFGVVKGYNKAKLHVSHGHSYEEFSGMLLSLLDFLPPHVSFVDGIEVMHKAGPIKGEPLDFNLVAAGTNVLALDTAISKALDVDIDQNPLLLLARKQKIAGASVKEIKFPLLEPTHFHPSLFEPPHTRKPISFHPVQLVTGAYKRVLARLR